MSSKQEILRYLRDQAGDLAIGYDTDLEEITSAMETDMEHLVDDLEAEFGIELPDDVLPDVETVADLINAVRDALRGQDDDE